MTKNYLKLNEEKTEILIISKRASTTPGQTQVGSIDIGGHAIVPATHVRNLGVLIDSSAKMDKQISNVCKGAFSVLRQISRHRSYLSDDAAATLVISLVTSKLDYCNSLLYGLPQNLLSKLERVQNSAARLVCRKSKHDHITQTLIHLHWLPIRERIEYKILLITFKALNGLAPNYLACLLHWYTPGRALRSSDSKQLFVPKTKLIQYGDRAFHYCAPFLWNKLPLELRGTTSISVFKRCLKTHLFRKAYNL